eukprot:TRINITY_DN20063_c0_g1_i3.p1 TRINITY_DN20063_c0_g1~~TRINITY_DN20063_c0_g1_i3.p1  ORF type:complete len:166 (-),score=53.15 TRINITY_DN20063_c0_g1_i3:377-874(-)
MSSQSACWQGAKGPSQVTMSWKAEKQTILQQKGCNLLVRKELLNDGYDVGRCQDGDTTWCLEQQMNLTDNTPYAKPARELLRFAPGREAMYVACELTIGRRRSALARALPEALDDVGATLKKVCEEAAQCGDRKRMQALALGPRRAKEPGKQRQKRREGGRAPEL